MVHLSGTKYMSVAQNDAPKQEIYKVYPTRWLVLATVCLLALTNASMWVAYAPLSEETAAFYCDGKEDCSVLFWTSQIFQAGGVLFGIAGMYVTDKYGVKVSALCGTSLNFLGAMFRILSSLPAVPMAARIPILYFGQTVASLAQAFFLVLSPKVAEFWFPEDQRTLANALSFIANPAGVCTGALTPVFVVGTASADFYGFFVLNCVLGSLATVCFIMSLLIRSGKPPTPPSASSNNQSPPFFDGLKQLMKVKPFYIQWFTFGMAFALQWSLFFCTDAMLKTLNYPAGVTSYLMCASAIAGCITSILCGMFLDKYKCFNELIKGLYLMAACVAVSLCLFLRHERHGVMDDILLYLFFILLGSATIPVFPVNLELVIETTFPIAEATSTGTLVLIGQLILFILQSAMEQMPKFNWIYDKKVLDFPNSFASGNFTGKHSSGNFFGDLKNGYLKVDDIIYNDTEGYTGNFTGKFNGNWTDEDTKLDGTFTGSFLGTSLAAAWNFQLAIDFWTMVTILSTIYTCVLLWPQYKRLEFEKQNGLKRETKEVTGKSVNGMEVANGTAINGAPSASAAPKRHSSKSKKSVKK